MRWDQVTSHQIRSDQIRSDQIRSDQIRSDQITPDHITSDEITSDQIRSDHIRSHQIKSHQITEDSTRAKNLTKPNDDYSLSHSKRATPSCSAAGAGGVSDLPLQGTTRQGEVCYSKRLTFLGVSSRRLPRAISALLRWAPAARPSGGVLAARRAAVNPGRCRVSLVRGSLYRGKRGEGAQCSKGRDREGMF